MNDQAETLDFQVETRQLLQLMINSVYSDKDLFLRELVSNASDALDKLRLERFHNDDLDADTSDLHIEIEIGTPERTLTIRDNGIGMSRAEVVDLIGKIANSGTASFVRELQELQAAGSDDGANVGTEELIGRFGVGFYSTFMVADEVTLVTRRAGETEATRWQSRGEGTYTIETLPNAPQGTSITLHLKPADPEDRLFDYTDALKIREIISRYSDFISWPIRMAPIRATDADGSEDGSDVALETINSSKALWAHPAGDVTEADYSALYKRISHDWNDPLETIRLQIEGTLQYQALLFIPAQAAPDLFSQDAKRGVQLYVSRVFVMDNCEALMPSYLRFVKGVVDSADLALNVSREILQQDRQIEAMRRRLTKKVLSVVKDMSTKRPEKYATLWKAFGPVIKEGLLQDYSNRDAILQVCSFQTTHDTTTRTTLREYVERMGDAQEDIFYMTGESRAAIENSPYMEAFQAKGLEVLLLTDPIDEIWVDAIPEFEGKKFQSITKGAIDLDGDDESDGGREEQQEQFTDLLGWMTTILEKDIKEVRLSTRLTVSPACIVSDAHDATPALINMYRAMGQHLPQGKRILELNAEHRLVSGLRAAHTARPDDPKLSQTAELLYGLALLAENGQLEDPSRFVHLMAEHLGEAL